MKVMNQRIELWLNIVHYCIYRAENRRYILFNKLNPFLLLGKIPAVKRKFEEEGTSHKEVVNKLWTDRRYGFGVMISGGVLVIIVFLILLAIFDMLSSLLLNQISFSWQPFVTCMVFAYIICHFSVFQNDKYISYFKKFDKKSRQEKRKYGLLSLAFVVGALVLWIYSFRFIPLS